MSAPVSISIRVVGEGGGEDPLPLPRYETASAAGMDLRAAIREPMVLAPGQRVLVPTGVAIALPEGYEGQVRPRSGLSLRHGITVLNAPGTVDADYRGELAVLLVNLGTEPFAVARGDRVAQLVVASVTCVRWQMVSELDDTGRGAGGYGSTGGG